MKVTYLIQAGGYDGPVKIGSTAGDPEKRLRQLQVGNARPLELIWVFPEDIETELHGLFRAHQLMGEWFAPCVMDLLIHEFGVVLA